MQSPVPTARMSLRRMYDIGVCVVGELTVDWTTVEILYDHRERRALALQLTTWSTDSPPGVGGYRGVWQGLDEGGEV